MMNFLEALAAEWYEYNGYFVRTNSRARKRLRGGWDVELDVLAYSPVHKRLIHVEISGDAYSLAKRKEKLKKKFILEHEEYKSLIGPDLNEIKKIAILGWSSTNSDCDLAKDIEVVTVPQFIKEIAAKLKAIDPMREAVPEGFPLLRAMQMALAFEKK